MYSWVYECLVKLLPTLLIVILNILVLRHVCTYYCVVLGDGEGLRAVPMPVRIQHLLETAGFNVFYCKKKPRESERKDFTEAKKSYGEKKLKFT